MLSGRDVRERSVTTGRPRHSSFHDLGLHPVLRPEWFAGLGADEQFEWAGQSVFRG
ncbi:hypothetical protein GCM10010104_71120 [Streptomyces indiaensis]|uniref:Uncharacterized protein n=1 Tax=Streptomyces indiaensis TaxID=284033 RepID=A0ABN3EMW6_9ACTN